MPKGIFHNWRYDKSRWEKAWKKIYLQNLQNKLFSIVESIPPWQDNPPQCQEPHVWPMPHGFLPETASEASHGEETHQPPGKGQPSTQNKGWRPSGNLSLCWLWQDVQKSSQTVQKPSPHIKKSLPVWSRLSFRHRFHSPVETSPGQRNVPDVPSF